MSRTRLWLTLGGLAATFTASFTACTARTPSPPPAPPASARIPPGCERNQAGEYEHADNPGFRYQGEDDGGTLTLAVTRIREEEATPPEPDGGTAVSIVLQRTPEGFLGETRATTFTPAGTACPVSFATQAVGCDERGLTLRSVTSAALDENCHPAPRGVPPPWKEQRLVRREHAGAPAPDAGTSPRTEPPPGEALTPRGGPAPR